MFKMMFRSFQPMLEEDDGLNIGGTGEEEQEVADPDVTEEGEEEQEVADPVDKSDAAFAEMRRLTESLTRELEETRARAEELEYSNGEYERALGLYFDGENKAAQAISHYDETPIENVLADMQARRELKEQERATASLEEERDRLLFENMKMKDLAELRAAGVTDLNDVAELGEEYFAMRAMGIAPKMVYDGLQLKKGVAPKPVGKVKPSAPEKTFYSRDEVMSMSPKERTKNYEKIRESMLKW